MKARRGSTVLVTRMNSDTHKSTPPTRVSMSRKVWSSSPSMGANKMRLPKLLAVMGSGHQLSLRLSRTSSIFTPPRGTVRAVFISRLKPARS